ncbi:DUF1302 family protein, partial [Candidatus Omnitrophota bacterium]
MKRILILSIFIFLVFPTSFALAEDYKYVSASTYTSPSETTKIPESNSAKSPLKKIISKLDLDKKYLGMHGYVETRHYYDTHKDWDAEFTYEMRNDARISKELTFSPKFHGFASADARLYVLRNSAESYETTNKRFRLWELYMDYTEDEFDLRVGMQSIRWGKSDEVNPTDVFTPQDLTEPFNRISRAERKVPVFAVKHVSYFDIVSIESIWIPFFKKDWTDTPGGPWDAFLPRFYRAAGMPFLDDDDCTDKTLKNSTVAFKTAWEQDTYDISLSYSSHFPQLPTLVLQPFRVQVAPGFELLGARVKPSFKRQHTIGGDYQTTIGKLGIRAEWAYTTNVGAVSYDPNIESSIIYKDIFDYDVGVDYTFANNLYVNLQYTMLFIPDYQAMLSAQRVEDSILWRVEKDLLNDTLKLKTTSRYYLSTQDLFMEIGGEYDINDHL